MATIANLKTAFTADTSGLKKGSNEAKTAIKDFEKVGNDSLDSIAQMFGISTEQVRKFASAAKGAAASVARALKATDAQAVELSKNIGLAAAGIAGLSVATLVAAWKELNAEAEYYYQSMEGSIDKAGLDSYVSTLRGATLELRNLAANTQKLMEMQTGWANFTNALKSAFAGTMGFSVTGKDGVLGAMEGLMAAKAAQEVAKVASEDAKELQRLNIEIVQQEYKIYEYDQKIAEAKLAAKDANNDIATRQKAVAEAQKAINDRAAELAPIYEKLISLQTQYNEYTLTPLEDLKKLNSYKKAAADLVKQQADQSRELLELTTQIAKKAQEETAARQAAYQAMLQMNQYKEMISGISGASNTTNAQLNSIPKQIELNPQWAIDSLINLTESMREMVENTELNIKLKADFEAFQAKMSEVNTMLTNGLNSAVQTGLSGLGEAIGAAISGAENPSAILLNTVAALMKQLGELAIGAGTTMLGIEAAFKSMDGYAAIAAGVALVALASAVSASVGSMASSFGTSGAISGGSTYTIGSGSTYAYNKTSSASKVEVTGTLKASGNQLIAVIDNTKKTNGYIR